MLLQCRGKIDSRRLSQKKKLESPTKLKLDCKRVYPAKSVKYCGVQIDANLNLKQHIHKITIKLNRPKALANIDEEIIGVNYIKQIRSI